MLAKALSIRDLIFGPVSTSFCVAPWHAFLPYQLTKDLMAR